MAENDLPLGLVFLAFAIFFLLSGMGLMKTRIFEPEFSTFIAFVLVAVGIYLITKK